MPDNDRGLAGKVSSLIDKIHFPSFAGGMFLGAGAARPGGIEPRLAWAGGAVLVAALLVYVVGGILKNMFVKDE